MDPQTKKFQDYFDKIYSANPRAFGAGEPEPVVVKLRDYFTAKGFKNNFLNKIRQIFLGAGYAGEVLEIGAGQGRNAIFLAEAGFKVRAVDISPVGIQSIKNAAKEKGLRNISAEVCEAKEALDRDYDSIVATIVLHLFAPDEARSLIALMKSRTRRGGLHAISAFLNEGDLYKLNAGKIMFFPTAEELKSMYADWDIVSFDIVPRPLMQKHPDGSPMHNIGVNILARRA